jgi:hypothetical protein
VPWPSWLASAPSLVAEALVPAQDPLAGWLRLGPATAPESLAAALARAMLPPQADDAPPSWLRGDQRLSFSRALAAVRRYGGAVLADGVGTGKTFIGLAAAAAADPAKPIHVLAPAALLAQWREAAARVGVRVLLHSHETLSRGRLPPAAAGPVVIDESQRCRNPLTRRYETLAPWCAGRRGVLLSATPAVNRLEDLSHQLLLFVRDDALGWAGVASLRMLAGPMAEGALAELVITGEDRSASLPDPATRDLRPEEPPGSRLEAMRAGVLSLRLSRERAISGLLRGVLLAALASSPLALADALGRYRSLLQHARDAAAAGRCVSRQAIRRIIGSAGDQLVLWPLVAEGVPASELALDDLEPAAALEAAARAWGADPDAKLLALREVLADGKSSLVFTTTIATVRYLRRHLGRGVAWCTGRSAGLDAATAEREAVLDWFRKPVLRGDGLVPRPTLLIATDVAAEGLDLPLLQRVVHYDLPWTAVRLEQRSGRALRLGSLHRQVEVLRFLPARSLEATLRQEAILESKAALPEQLGLGQAGDAPWRLRARIAARWQEVAPSEGIGVTRGARAAAVAGFRLGMSDGSVREVVRARIATGWTDDAATIAELLEAAHGARLAQTPPARALRPVFRALTVLVRAALRNAHGARLLHGARSTPSRRALGRVLALAREAARQRERERLALLERGLRLLRRGHTAGEGRLIERWPDLPLAALLAILERLPAEPDPPEVTRVELIGVLLVEPPSRGR